MGYGWGVFSSEALYASFDGKDVFVRRLVNGTLLSGHLHGLGDGRERFRDALNFDLSSATESARPDPCSVSGKDDCLGGFGFVFEIRVGVALGGIGAPMRPVPFPSFGSLTSDSICNCSPSKQEITRELSFVGILNSRQEVFCGRGK